MKKNKGITMISLVITIIVLLIVTSITIYNGVEQLGIKRVNSLYADIDSISTKVADYYLKNESLPIYENNKYVDSKEELEALFRRNGATENITNVNDGEDYYVLKLSKLDNLTLNYGEDYRDWEDTSTADDIQNLYIINSVTHQIYFPHGVRSGDDYYFARFPDENVVSPIELEDVDANWTMNLTNISQNNIDENYISLVADITLNNLGENYNLNSLEYAWTETNEESELENISFSKFNVKEDKTATLASKSLRNIDGNYYLCLKIADINGKTNYKYSEGISVPYVSLPNEFQKVEYIESTGTQWINTQIPIKNIANLDTDFNLKFAITKFPGTYILFGSDIQYRQMVIASYRLRCDWTKSTHREYYSSILGENQVYTITQKNGYLYFQNESQPIETTTTSDYHLGIFGKLGSNDEVEAASLAKMRLYRFEVTKNSISRYNFIPCYRKSDNVKGLYEVVEGEFYTNENTEGDDFTAGNEIY